MRKDGEKKGQKIEWLYSMSELTWEMGNVIMSQRKNLKDELE